MADSENLPRPSEREPISFIPTDADRPGPQAGIGLCLSGGGFRAMLFHLGAVWRLNEAGVLGKLTRISSVSGGSIVAAVLGMRWTELGLGPDKAAAQADFDRLVVEPIRSLGGRTIDAGAIIGGILLPGTIGDKIENAYSKHLYGDATLQNLPDEPRFVINATNVQTGALWRFMKPYMADYRVGMVMKPTVPLAKAVAASSAFPPVLSPVELEFEPSDFKPDTGLDLQTEPYTTQVVLTDGGVYDNLGLETVWKKYRTVLVSDAGGKIAPEGDPKRDWGRHAYRVLELIDNQVRSLRKRQLVGGYVNPDDDHDGAYWGIRSDILHYGLAEGDFLDCPVERTGDLADTPTRLKRVDEERQERLINWGYAICDAAVRKHVDSKIPAPPGFPYPRGV